jgi:hypothetical protein
MLVWKALVRLVGLVLMLALALLALGIALYCLDGVISLGSARPDRLLHLASVRRHVGHFLDQIAASGSTAGLALLCGAGAMALGGLLIAGLLRSPKQRLAVLSADGADDAADGTLAARPRALGDMSRALAEQVPAAASIDRPKLRLARRANRGRLTMTVSRTRTSDPAEVKCNVTERLKPISGPFRLTPRVRVRLGERRERVQ